MAFIERAITITFIKANGTFVSTGTNVYVVSGMRIQCDISNFIGVTKCQANVRIFGLTHAHMIELSNMNSAFMVQRNIKMDISAGVAGAMNLIFTGDVVIGQIDLNNAPESALVILGQSGQLLSVMPAQVNSWPTSIDHFTILKKLASLAGLAFSPNGSPITLTTPYLYGSVRDQIIRVCDQVMVNFTIMNDTLYVWDRYGVVTGNVPLISATTGMVGYPTYSDLGITVRTLFNAALRVGQLVTVNSTMDFANGSWQTYTMSHELESQTPNGKWFTSFQGMPYNGKGTVGKQ